MKRRPNGLNDDEMRAWIFSMCKTNGECLEWTAGKTKSGYPNIEYAGETRGNRVMALLIFGRDQLKSKVVCHRCDNPSCLNPDHLFLGTQFENIQDRVRKNRTRSAIGERTGSAKLSESQAREVLAAARSGERYPSIAMRFGVHKETIGRIARGEYWSHLQKESANAGAC